MSLEAVSSRPSNTGTGRLVVEVDPAFEYDALSDLGLTVSSSPTLTNFEVSTPASISSFPHEFLAVFPAPKKLVKGSPAYELR